MAEDEEDLSFFLPSVPKVDAANLQAVVASAKALQVRAQQSPTARKEVAASVATAASLLPPANLKKAVEWVKDLAADASQHLAAAVDLLASIRELGIAAPCLGRPGAPHAPLGNHRYLIAANLGNNEALMPFWILEVLRLGLMLQGSPPVLNAIHRNATSAGPNWDPTVDPTVHISVYESGSTDNTPVWLEVAEAIWAAAGFRTTVVVHGPLKRETLLDPLSGRYYKQHRVEYAASLRNAALAPLYNSSRGAYDYVFFLTDVFFCAPELFRLTHLQADIACGMDFEVWVGEQRASLPQATKARRQLLVAPEGGGAAAVRSGADVTPPDWQQALMHMAKVHGTEAARMAAAEQRAQEAKVKPRYEFSDTWVSRDVGGNPFVKVEPTARDKRTIKPISEGLPIPAKCCWNGAVLINATHLAAGLRFRAGYTDDGECDISEASLLCEDYRRLSSRKVAVDPSVRVSNVGWTKEFHGRLPGGIGAKVPWLHVKRSGALEEVQRLWRGTHGCMSVQCVPLDKATEEANIHKFKVIKLDKVNFTSMFFERYGKPPQPQPPAATCNLIMGPYGAYVDGHAFDDLGLTNWGQSAITRLRYRVAPFVAPGVTQELFALSGLQATYAAAEAPDHGGEGVGEEREIELQPEEYFNNVQIWYDRLTVYGMRLTTSTGRDVELGSFPSDASKAVATPCPADPARKGRFRLISFAGTADKFVRSLTFVWA